MDGGRCLDAVMPVPVSLKGKMACVTQADREYMQHHCLHCLAPTQSASPAHYADGMSHPVRKKEKKNVSCY
ncbi:hypothetical protein E2C01_042608 [Portunus trituberculatus]|uniref:Uncharacterized protein n=1 Tax=Portunus trituberculatus TaxID=210409 RepID=A0A5B7FWZ2_PORTR|nr:hypothetical protein [Portunus trituberculatus]